MRHREAAPILRPSTYKQQSGVSWLSKTVQQQPSKNNANPTANLQESYSKYHSNLTSIPHFHSNPTTIQSNAIVKSDIDATAIPKQSYTNLRQSHSKTGARAEIPYSNCAVLTQQLHRAISQQSCKNLTVMSEEGHNNPAAIDHAKCKFHIKI